MGNIAFSTKNVLQLSYVRLLLEIGSVWAYLMSEDNNNLSFFYLEILTKPSLTFSIGLPCSPKGRYLMVDVKLFIVCVLIEIID